MNKAIDPALMHAAEATGTIPGVKMDAYWMPFTANRQFKKAPRLLARASGMHYWDDHGRQILDGVAGSVVRERRPRTAAHRAGHPAAGGRTRLRAAPSRWPTRRPSNWPNGWRRSRRPA